MIYKKIYKLYNINLKKFDIMKNINKLIKYIQKLSYISGNIYI